LIAAVFMPALEIRPQKPGSKCIPAPIARPGRSAVSKPLMRRPPISWTLSNTDRWSHPLAPPPPLPPAKPKNRSPPPPIPIGGFSPSANSGPHTDPLETLRNQHKNSTSFPSQQELPNDPPATANLMQLYYAYFHASHPFCLPPAYLIKTPVHQLTVLLPVMRYIASFFARAASTMDFCREAEMALFGSAHPPAKDPFTVQALLLFTIGLHSEGEYARAAQVKDFAVELALELGMNQKEFSECDGGGGGGGGGGGDPGRILQESWRRTWWELYFVDGLMAGVHQRDNFKLWSVECTVPLPCEELDYAAGRIPEPHSLQEFDDRYFAAENTVFSSFAYRVEAVRILGQVLSVSMMGTPDEIRADAADASLANWGLHLPDIKKELVKGRERRVDEMLFQAHMVINAYVPPAPLSPIQPASMNKQKSLPHPSVCPFVYLAPLTDAAPKSDHLPQPAKVAPRLPSDPRRHERDAAAVVDAVDQADGAAHGPHDRQRQHDCEAGHAANAADKAHAIPVVHRDARVRRAPLGVLMAAERRRGLPGEGAHPARRRRAEDARSRLGWRHRGAGAGQKCCARGVPARARWRGRHRQRGGGTAHTGGRGGR